MDVIDKSQKISKYIPAADWLKTYSTKDLQGDFFAGLTVGVMLIPQGMAYAMLAGLPPVYGLYASLVPLIVYAFLGTSRQLGMGPVAMISLMIFAGVSTVAEPGSDEYISLVITLALLTGVIQLLMGLLRLGFLVNLLAHPVIAGFTSAAAIIIGLSQLQHLLGVSIPPANQVHLILSGVISEWHHIHLPTLVIGVISIALIISAKKIHRMLPGPILAVVIMSLVVWFTGLNEDGVRILGSVPEGLPAIVLPFGNTEQIMMLLPLAAAIALVSFIESFAVAKAIQMKHKNYQLDADQELRALGAANIAGSFLQSFTVTGGFSRTAVNDQSGGKTGVSLLISALLVGLTLLFFTPLFYYLPGAVLAAIIMAAVYKLIDLNEAFHLWKLKRADFLMFTATFLVTLFIGIIEGIAAGVVISVIVVMYRVSYPHAAVLGRLPGTHIFRNVTRYPDAERFPNTLIIRYDSPLFFANSQHFRDLITGKVNLMEDKPENLLLDFSGITEVDSSALGVIEEISAEMEEKNIRLILCAVKGPVRDMLHKSEVLEKRIPDQNWFMDVDEACLKLELSNSTT